MGEEGDAQKAPFGMQKAKSACCCCILGVLLLPGMMIMLGANEKGYVCRNKDILYAGRDAEVVGCTGTPPSDKFVFFSCQLQQADLQSWNLNHFNPYFSGSLATAVSFTSAAAQQSVEMHQCVETKTQTTTGSGNTKQTTTNYSYSLQWATLQDASKFGRTPTAAECPDLSAFGQQNPGFPPNVNTQSPVFRQDRIKVGMFTLHSTLAAAFLPDSAVDLQAFQSAFPTTLPTSAAKTNPMPAVTQANIKPILDGGRWYLRTCETYKLGCIRMSFRKSAVTDASVFANSGSGGVTKAQPTKSSWGCGAGTYEVIATKQITKDQSLSSQESANNGALYTMRVFGILGCWLAVFCCFYPIIAAVDIVGDYLGKIPCIGCMLKMIADIVETLVYIAVCCMSCSFGCSCALFTIAVVWVVMRPLAGILLFIAVLLMVVGAFLVMKFVPKKEARTELSKVVPGPDPEAS